MSFQLITATSEVEKELTYSLRYRSYVEELKWIMREELTEQQRSERLEFDEYDLNGQALNFLALHEDAAIGTIRLVFENEIPLPIEKDFQIPSRKKLGIENMAVAEVSRLIVRGPGLYRIHAVALALIAFSVQETVKRDIDCWYASFDTRAWELVKYLGFRFRKIGGIKFYMGSNTVPTLLAVEENKRFLQQKKPDLYSFCYDGKDPKAIVVDM